MYNYKIHIKIHMCVCVCNLYLNMYTFNVLKIYIKIVKLFKYMENKPINGIYY